MDTTEKKEKKKEFKMPHLLWIMVGLIIFMTLLTYVIPAGNFAKDEATGKLLGDQFEYVGHQTPVSFARAAMMIFGGLTGSATVIFSVLVGGAGVGVILKTGAVDDFLNWAIYKLKDKGSNVLLPLLFILMGYLGAFGGGDKLIAVVPIGVAFARKMKLDPIVAIGVTTFATMVGFGTGPTRLLIPQTMMGVPIYSGFGNRFLSLNLFLLIGLAYLMWYVKKIEKDPNKSIMGNTEWLETVSSDVEIKETKLSWRTAVTMIMFFGQYGLIVWYTMKFENADTYAFMTATQLIVGTVAGVINKMSADDIANAIAKGVSGMAFVGFIIGLARVVSTILGEGQIIHTIVYTLTRPLMDVSREIAVIGLTGIIALINPIIPSASSKAAILIPIIQPVTEALGIHPQVAVSAFQFGDGFTNLVSPVLGWTVGSCAAAGVSFDKWLKFAMPIVIFMIVVSFGWMYVINSIGWTGI